MEWGCVNEYHYKCCLIGGSYQEKQCPLQDSASGVISLDEVMKHTGVTDEQLKQECDDVLLGDIAEHIVNYQKYGPKLGLSAADITTFQQNMRIADNAKLITAEVFKKWHKKQSFLATYKVLAEVALELGDGTGAKVICEICAKGTLVVIVWGVNNSSLSSSFVQSMC